MSLPDYVEYGPLATVFGPLRCTGATEWAFALEGDQQKIEALCRKVFADPTGGEIDVRPLGRHVLLSLGRVDRIATEVAPYDRMGWSPESQVAIWVPVARVSGHGNRLVAEELFMFTPYMLVDNPVSLASGREMYGYPKAWAWALLPDPGADGPTLGVDVFGMNYDRDQAPTRQPLIRIEQGERVHEVADVAFSSLLDIGRYLRHIVESRPGEAVRLGLHFAEHLIRDVRAGSLPQVYLKQIRAVEDGEKAALQQITEARYTLLRLRGVPLGHEYAVTIEALDSHPLGAELGLESQTTIWGFRAEADFTLGPGRVLWGGAGT